MVGANTAVAITRRVHKTNIVANCNNKKLKIKTHKRILFKESIDSSKGCVSFKKVTCLLLLLNYLLTHLLLTMQIEPIKLVVKTSTLPGAGKGLFTKEFIAKDTCFLEYKGNITAWKEVSGDDHNAYIFFVNRNHVIDASKHLEELARYINDARGIKKVTGINNNTYYAVVKKRVFVYATKDIPAGSELFVGYGKDYWDTIRANIKKDLLKAKPAK